jgi:hypothetical protein
LDNNQIESIHQLQPLVSSFLSYLFSFSGSHLLSLFVSVCLCLSLFLSTSGCCHFVTNLDLLRQSRGLPPGLSPYLGQHVRQLGLVGFLHCQWWRIDRR